MTRVGSKINYATMDRIIAITKMPRSEYTVDAIVEAIALRDADPVLFVDLIEMQMKFIDAAHTFAEKRLAADGQNTFLRILSSISSTAGYVVSLVTRLHPMPGLDVAQMVHLHCGEFFSDALGLNIAWTQPPETKTPTHASNNTLN